MFYYIIFEMYKLFIMMCISNNSEKWAPRGLWVREKTRIHLLPYESITHVYHSSGSSNVHMGKDLLQSLRTPLTGLEQVMPRTRFFRTHRNYIINRSFIQKYDREDALIYSVCGQIIPVSRRKKKPFERFLENRN